MRSYCLLRDVEPGHLKVWVEDTTISSLMFGVVKGKICLLFSVDKAEVGKVLVWGNFDMALPLHDLLVLFNEPVLRYLEEILGFVWERGILFVSLFKDIIDLLDASRFYVLLKNILQGYVRESHYPISLVRHFFKLLRVKEHQKQWVVFHVLN